jgi:hypothetical protein
MEYCCSTHQLHSFVAVRSHDYILKLRNRFTAQLHIVTDASRYFNNNGEVYTLGGILICVLRVRSNLVSLCRHTDLQCVLNLPAIS